MSRNNKSYHKEPMSQRSRRIWGLGFGIFLIIFWEMLAFLIGKAYILPGPVDVLESLWEHRVEIFTQHLPATMKVVCIGSVCSILIGTALAILMDRSSLLERALYPILTATQTIPTMCIAPVFVLWFGYSITMRVIVVILVTFFSITVNLFDGFHAASEARMELMQTFGATEMQQFTMLRMPTALPYFFTALQVAVPWSVVGAAVAEWLGAPSGLGTYSRSCMMNLDAAGLLAPLVVLTVIALALNGILKLLERRLVTWRGEA